MQSSTTSTTGEEEDVEKDDPAAGQVRDKDAEGRKAHMRELARRRWEKEKAQGASGDGGSDPARSNEPDDGRTALVRVPVEIGAIIGTLARAAKRKDVAAARELREWLRIFPPEDERLDVAGLDRKTRQKLLARLLAAIAERDSPAQKDFQGSSKDGFDSALTAREVRDATPAQKSLIDAGAPEAPQHASHTAPSHDANNGSHPADGTTSPEQAEDAE